MNSIKAISDSDIHSITSGQVITDVNSIIKELLENSIDANSRNIEITLKDYCLNGIEIKDDGHGISENDFDTLCLKHYTSKITKFDDINTNLINLGFRGEALNSICFISKTVIMTCTNDEGGMGHELHYNHNGDLIKQEIIPMDKGTTIVIDDIFENLPVRRMNFEKNYRKATFNKCVRLIQDYCIINYDINIKVWNVVDNKRKLVLSNIGQQSINSDEIMNLQYLLKNCNNLFGSSKMKGVNEIKLDFTMPSKKSFVKEHHFEGGEITIEGLISQKSFGFGKTSKTDNQFIYINKRPLDYSKISNIINEEYKKYNHLQYPFFVLNFNIPVTILDLNVTPDKRTVLVHNESVFLGMLRECLAEFWDNDGMMLYDNTQNIQSKRKVDDDEVRLVRQKTTATAVQEECSDNDSYLDVYKEVNEDRIPTFDEVFNTSELSGSSTSINDKRASTRIRKGTSLQQFKYHEDTPLGDQKIVKQFQSKITSFLNSSTKPVDDENEDEVIIEMDGERTIEKLPMPKRVLISPSKSSRHECSEDAVDNESVKKLLKSVSEDILPSQEMKVTDLIDISTLEKKMTLNMRDLRIKPISQKPNSKCRHMFSTNADIENTDLQERLLTLTVSKQDFLKMKAIGQFNLGFIICTRKLESGYDMFIIDQHASDEKYNFEQLFKNTIINVQPLIKPVPIELNPLDKILIKDHVDVFTKNGFKLKFADNGTDDIYLETLPLSEKTQFTIDDFFEIMDLLRANEGAYKVSKDIRCSKVRSMFAMRACRMSIMIGRPLNVQVMKRIVGNLGVLDKPWNCPHGRPTIRHLMELRSYNSFNSDYVL